MKAEVFTSPQYPDQHDAEKIDIFLAGSIEQGKADRWQDRVIEELKELPVRIYNPRREHWDADLLQDISNPVFSEQVEWEMNLLEGSHTAFFYFQGTTLSPISLAELGMAYAMIDNDTTYMRNVVVVCEPGFWRRGNVQIICARAGFPMFSDLEQGIMHLRKQLHLHIARGVR